MDALMLLAVRLITLHNVEGAAVHVNPEHVVTMREARDPDRSLVTGKVRCFLTLTDGKYQTVVEDCKTVRRLIEEARP